MNKIRLPYGISNFKILVSQGYYFVDKTQYIEKLENLNERYLFFLRPIRFGKSLFVSLLTHYYGIEHEEHFSDLFGKYYIRNNPTPERNHYYILSFDFSRIPTSTVESTLSGFAFNVRLAIENFNNRYEFFNKNKLNKIVASNLPNEMLSEFFTAFMGEKKENLILTFCVETGID
jgi:hypothetical protein